MKTHYLFPVCLCLAALVFTLSACKSYEQLYEKGEYQQIINKLDGKAKKGKLERNEKSIFVKSINNDLRSEHDAIYADLESEDFEDWHSARKKTLKLEKIRAKYLQFPQIREDDLDPSPIDNMLKTADDKLYAHYLDDFTRFEAEYINTGVRSHIINAYSAVQQMVYFGGETAYHDSLQQYTLNEGHRKIYYEFDSDVWNNFEFNTHFERDIDLDNTLWNTYVTTRSSADYNLEIGAEIQDTDERIRENTRTYRDEIIDGYTETKDTSGQVIQTPIYKEISARVRTLEYEWKVEGVAFFTLQDIDSRKIIARDEITTTLYDRDAINHLISGDEEAVPGNVDLSFQSDIRYDYDDLIGECFEELADRLNDYIEDAINY